MSDLSDVQDEGRPDRDRREVVRLAAGIVVILAFVALAALAIAASRSSFEFSLPAAAAERTAEPAPEPAAPPAAPRPFAVVPLSPPPALPSVPVANAEAAPVVPALPPPPALPEEGAGKPCAALGLPAPDKVGGLQSLIRLVPLFGPFSPEAFAMMPAFEPGFEVLGPLFPVFEQGLDSAAPLLDLITPPAQQLGQAGFGVLAPLYGPYRDDVLAAEAQLAAFLQPIVRSLATAPGSECLIALEGLLASLQPGAQ